MKKLLVMFLFLTGCYEEENLLNLQPGNCVTHNEYKAQYGHLILRKLSDKTYFQLQYSSYEDIGLYGPGTNIFDYTTKKDMQVDCPKNLYLSGSTIETLKAMNELDNANKIINQIKGEK